MARTKKPKSELDQLESRNLYRTFEDSLFFYWSRDEINKIADLSLNLRFGYSNSIVRRNEPVTWFGIVLEGQCLISIGSEKIALIGPGSLIGTMAALQTKAILNHVFDVTGTTDGVVGVFYIEDLQNLYKKSAKVALKFVETIGKYASDTVCYQFFHATVQEQLKINYVEYSTRRKQEFIRKHPLLGSNSELDRIDIKILAALFKVIHPKDGVLITKSGCIEDSVFFVVEGQVGILEQKVIEDDIFGTLHFLKPGLLWEHSVIGIKNSTILCMNLKDFNDIVSKFANTAIKFLKIVTEIHARSIFDKKTHNIPGVVHTSQEFVEIDVMKLSIEPNFNKITEESDEEHEFKSPLPLYTFPMFEVSDPVYENSLQKMQKPLSQTSLTMKDSEKPATVHEKKDLIHTNTDGKKISDLPESNTYPELIFPKSKLAKQTIEANAKKRTKSPRTFSPKQKKKELKIENEIAVHFAEIANDLKKLEKENDLLIEQIRKLEHNNQVLESEINAEILDNEHKSIVLKKIKVLKDISGFTYNKEMSSEIAENFNKILVSQVENHRTYYLWYKYAEKWKDFVKHKKTKYL